jgi:hypothetical protein
MDKMFGFCDKFLLIYLVFFHPFSALTLLPSTLERFSEAFIPFEHSMGFLTWVQTIAETLTFA